LMALGPDSAGVRAGIENRDPYPPTDKRATSPLISPGYSDGLNLAACTEIPSRSESGVRNDQ
jgi:hypothetical protein